MRISDWSSDVCSSDLIGRPRESVLAFDRKDVGDLHHVQQRGYARGDVLAVACCGRKECIMVAHQLYDQRRDIFCQRMLIGGVIGDMHLGNASDFCCLFAYAAADLARDPPIDRTSTRLNSSHYCAARMPYF